MTDGRAETPHETAGKVAKADTRSGLQQVADLAAGKYPASPMTQLMPFATLPPEKGKVSFRATPDDRLLNGMGIVHGGWVMTMLDNAMGLTAHTMVEAGEYCPSKETTVQFIKPVFANGDELSFTCTVTSSEGRNVVVESRMETTDGKLLATGKSTCVIIRPKSA